MWGRVVELMVAVWISLSPFIFRVTDDATIMWVDQLTALTICIVAGMSFWEPLQHTHVVTFPLSAGLMVWGRFAEMPPPPIHQNHIVVGFFLMLMVFVPNDASYPPLDWQDKGDEYAP